MDEAVFTECYVDTNLVETVAPPQRRGQQQGYNHQYGCNNVAKKMQEAFSDGFSLGIIDKDKKDIDYLREFDEAARFGSLILHKHRTKHHYIIQISPAIEQFILTSAAAVNIRLEQYGLPSDLVKLTKVSKKQNSKDNPAFRNLFMAIRKAGSAEFLMLAKWVEYLKGENYAADMVELRAFVA